jgi:hypothetical protein
MDGGDVDKPRGRENDEVFEPNIPDFFQHQNWGAAPDFDPLWETMVGAKTAANPQGIYVRGWCDPSSFLNMFYYWKTKPGLQFNMFPATGDDITKKDKWLAAFTKEIPSFVADYDKFQTLANRPQGDTRRNWAMLANSLNYILHHLGVGPDNQVKKGLVLQIYTQFGDGLTYLSADNKKNSVFPNTTLFAKVKDILTVGSTITLNLEHPDKAADWPRRWQELAQISSNRQLTDAERRELTDLNDRATANSSTCWWWTNGHAVTVVGYLNTEIAGTPRKELFFADPDCNPSPPLRDVGNLDSDAGWWNVEENKDPKDANSPIHKRRFQTTDPIPVPDKTPSFGDVSGKLYFPGILDAGEQAFKVGTNYGGKYKRYDGIKIAQAWTLELLTMENKPAAPSALGPADGSVLSTLQITPAQVGAPPVDEFWVFPGADYFVGGAVFNQPNWTYELIAPGAVDNFGNVRSFGGLHAYATTPFAAIKDTAVLEMQYNTASGLPLDRWDGIMNCRTLANSLRLQVIGSGDTLHTEESPVATCGIEGPQGGNVIGGSTIAERFDIRNVSSLPDTFVWFVQDALGWGGSRGGITYVQSGESVTAVIDSLTAPVGCAGGSSDTLVFASRPKGGAPNANTVVRVVTYTCTTSKAEGPPSSTTPKSSSRAPLLLQNVPNPFRSMTTMTFELPRPMHARIRVFDLAGRVVASVVDADRSAGLHRIAFERGRLKAGLYVIRMDAGLDRASRRMLVLP